MINVGQKNLSKVAESTKKNSNPVLPNQQNLKLCILCPQTLKYSETFIGAHIEYLSKKTEILYYTGGIPHISADGPLLSSSLLHRITRKLLKSIKNLPDHHFETAATKKFLQDKKVDVLLAEYGHAGIAIMEICKEIDIPLVVHFHGFDAYRSDVLEKNRKAYQKLFKIATALVAVSKDMEYQLVQLGAPKEKVFYNPYGVDTSLFQAADPGQASPLFVAVGRFVDKKAPHLTILAFEKTLRSVPNIRLAMIGDGPLLESCRQLSRVLGIADAVEFLGSRPHSEVANLMQQARAFVQHSIRTSYGDSEGTPVSILEAGATGLPVIATRHAGISDVVIDGTTGLLVDEGDIAKMAEYMIRLTREPTFASQLGQAARDHIIGRFTMKESISNLWSIIGIASETYQS